MTIRTSVMLLLAALLLGCTASHRATVAQMPPAEGQSLPIEFHFNLPVVEAQIDGQTARLIVDVGGHDTVTLTEAAIERLKVERRGLSHSVSFNAAGKMTIDEPIAIRELRLGDVILTDVEGHEIDFGGPPEFEQGIDGYVGAAVLCKFVLMVDYPAQIVLFPPTPHELWQLADWQRADIDDRITSRGTLNDRAVRVAWDTGANRTVIDVPTSSKLFGPDAERGNGTLSLGEIRFNALEFVTLDISGARVDAILGRNVFESHLVLFDFPNGRVYVMTKELHSIMTLQRTTSTHF
jgi:hypothetical protein